MKLILRITLLVTIFACFGDMSAFADDVKVKLDPAQRIDAAFRLFATDNMWTYLLLDTRDGRLWQVSFSITADGLRGTLLINEKPLLDAVGSKPGRFTLYPTANMWTFLMLDQEDGRVWQCQFSIDGKGNLILPLEDIRVAAIKQFLQQGGDGDHPAAK
jgi:hypothetical protein